MIKTNTFDEFLAISEDKIEDFNKKMFEAAKNVSKLAKALMDGCCATAIMAPFCDAYKDQSASIIAYCEDDLQTMADLEKQYTSSMTPVSNRSSRRHTEKWNNDRYKRQKKNTKYFA